MKANFIFCRTILLLSLTFILGACKDEFLPEDSRTESYVTTRSEVSEIWDGTVAENFAGGDGTESNPYQIANGEQLAKLAQDVNRGNGYAGTYFVLTADIVLNNTDGWENWGETVPQNTWTPIGDNANRFTGTLDGAGHSVSGIYISGEANYQGLVGIIGEGGTLQNLGIEASYIKGNKWVGGPCGENFHGTVSNCYNSATIIGYEDIGGVCGTNNNGDLTNCYNTGNVTGTKSYVGGVCGYNFYSTMTNCYNTGAVTSNEKVGGLCGYNMWGTVTNCYNTGNVAGSYHVGGVYGYNDSGTVTNCYYLNTCGAAGEGTSKSADEFKSGAVAYLLSNGTSGEIWGQNLTFSPHDTYPVLGGLKVVQSGDDSYANELSQDDGFYLISTADELRLFASIVNRGNTNIKAKLTADIVLNDTKDWESWDENTEGLNIWTPIGSYENQFTGILDGQGHSVSGIYINSASDHQGLVGYLGEGGSIQNIGINASYIKGGYYVGGACGYNNSGTITNCYNTSTITGNGDIGGMCGESSGSISNCNNSGNISGLGYCVAGVCGRNNKGIVTECYNTGSVTGNSYWVGGLCGDNNNILNNSYNTGSITGYNLVGGLCGQNNGNLTNSYNTGTITGTEYHVGSVCGENAWDFKNCYYLETDVVEGIGTAKSAEQFASGEVAYLLGEGWGQTIGTDNLPVLDAEGLKQIYAITLYNGTNEADNRYLNSNGTFPTLTGNAIAIVDAGSPFATGNNNIVVKDGDTYTCANLVLRDRESFYTPVEFTAGNATYSRYPWVWADGENGWETICLPFSGTLYADEQPAQPVDLDTNSGDYWLRNFTDFEAPNTLKFSSPQTAEGNMIEAGRPYLIALPGRAFPSNNMQEKYITVRGMNVKVIQNARPTEHYPFIFTGTFARETGQSASYILNSENDYMFGEANLFILSGASTLYPFRCRIDVTGFNVGRALSRSASSLPQVLRIGQ